jgi:hypothetical protein
MKRVAVIVAVMAVMVIGTWGCGGNGGSDARTKALDRRERALDQREKELDRREAATTSTTTTTAPTTYPAEVPVSTIRSDFVRNRFLGDGDTTAVILAPGVYARKGAGPVGDFSLYRSVVGETCADVERYQAEHGPVSSSC